MAWIDKRDEIMGIAYKDMKLYREFFCEVIRDCLHVQLENGAYDKKFNEAFDLYVNSPGDSTITITMSFTVASSNRDFYKLLFEKAQQRRQNALQSLRPGNPTND
jgi:hypothetical protein